jgi:hypothetical protein
LGNTPAERINSAKAGSAEKERSIWEGPACLPAARRLAMKLNLDGPQTEKLNEALNSAFKLNDLKRMLRFKLDKDLDNYVGPGSKLEVIFEIVDAAERGGWTDRLVTAGREFNPGNPDLLAFAETVGLASLNRADPQTRDNAALAETLVLQRLVSKRSKLTDIAAFREKLGRLETWVCNIEVPDGGGTGFLVGPELMLTNHHVVKSALNGVVSYRDIECRFDYRALPDGTVVTQGTICRLASQWCVDSSPASEADVKVNGGEPKSNELDYALIKLDQPIGKSPVGEGAVPGAPERGWLALPAAPSALVDRDPVFVLQHPDGKPLQLSLGTVLGFNNNGTRVRHNAATLGGSSGSPCFNADLDFVALHHAGDPNYDPMHKPTYNQAVVLRPIIELMRSRGIAIQTKNGG